MGGRREQSWKFALSSIGRHSGRLFAQRDSVAVSILRRERDEWRRVSLSRTKRNEAKRSRHRPRESATIDRSSSRLSGDSPRKWCESTSAPTTRPPLSKLSGSEEIVAMTCGFSTIRGSVATRNFSRWMKYLGTRKIPRDKSFDGNLTSSFRG